MAGTLLDDDAARTVVAGVFLCSEDVAAIVVRTGRQRDFAASTTILHQGDAVRITHMLLVGRARALLYAADGQVVLLHEYLRGDLFGALATLEAVVQDSDVVAVEDVLSLVFDDRDLAQLAQQHGSIGLALSRMLLQRLRQTTARIFERTALSAAGRIHAEILRLARQSADLAINPTPIVSDLALRAGTTRETASRAINALERRGIIARDGGRLRVIAPRRLEEMIL
jgi:CRP/FNR family transcriptional regulator, cyclic AMP receptor protein